MKLVAFSVKNFRSIQSTPRLELSNLTVLVGPNNEGKSNLLSALVCALALAQERTTLAPRTVMSRSRAYDFERDFPVALQLNPGKTKSTFDLEFELDEADLAEFTQVVGSKLNGTLPIQLSVDKDGNTDFAVKKPGRGQKALSLKRVQISRFIAGHLRFQYIGAVRDAEQSQSIVEDMVATALKALDQDPKYVLALEAIEEAQRPILESVAERLTETLQPFLGTLKTVSMTISKEQRARAIRRLTEIWLDDGTMTPLSQKGDGVKSLVSIALAKASAESAAGERNLILAIEEPEAHLHSGAIHALKTLLEEIAKARQVFISTHEPALVRRDDATANLLVQGNQAKPAKSLEEVRRALGVQLTENMVSPDLVLLVEGPSDAKLLVAYIRHAAPKVYRAISSGRLGVQPMKGAGNLSNQLRFFQAIVCNTVVFLDNDAAAHAALQKAVDDSMLGADAEFCATKPGLQESELEDLLDPAVYSQELTTALGLPTLKPKSAKAAKGKWSARLEAVLVASGKPQQDHERLIGKAKAMVCELAMAKGGSCFIPELTGPLDALIVALKTKLNIDVTA